MMKFSHSQHVCLVVSQWNHKYTHQLMNNGIKTLKLLGLAKEQIRVIQVPGCVEIPFASQIAAKNPDCLGLINYGCILRGETAHFDLVYQMYAQGAMQVMLKLEKPIICGVMTVDNDQQAQERCLLNGEKDIGAASAHTLISMLDLKA